MAKFCAHTRADHVAVACEVHMCWESCL